jgi:hemoglobin/transferrin/lactoferrin receptor protein
MKKYFIAFSLFYAYCAGLLSQTEKKDSLQDLLLKEVVIAPTLYKQNIGKLPQQIFKIGKKEITNTQSSNTADLLQQSGQVYIQKSQQGGGSITLRGLEANRNVIVIDGVRMNNLIYRGGHLHNVITTDVNAIESIEVMMGPASCQFGSDAMGGVVYITTPKPQFAVVDQNQFIKVHTQTRYTSANKGFSQHFDVGLGGIQWASWTSFSYSQFGDLKSGKNLNPFYPQDWGQRKYYAARIDGKDSLLLNDDPTVQRGSAYEQYDFIQKLSYRPNLKNLHTLNYQLSNSGNVPRYDRLTNPSIDGLQFAEWYYGPQTRNMIAYQYQHTFSKGLFNQLDCNIHHQQLEESRHTRKFGNDILQSRTEDVSVQGLNASLLHLSNRHQWRWGLDLQNNQLQSTAIATDIVTSATDSLDTRYPNGKNIMRSVALYSSHQYNIKDWLIFTDGLRAGYTRLQSTIIDFYSLANAVEQNNPTYSGSIGITAQLRNMLNTSFLVSSAYRVPNVDDLSKIFETAAGTIIVPNANLQPERSLTYEWNLRKVFGNVVAIENNAYYTQLKQMIVTDAFTYNGQDSILYDGVMSEVVANQNKGKGFIYGNALQVRAHFFKDWTTSATAHYTYGRIIEKAPNGKDSIAPLDHIPPLFARWMLTYQHDNVKADFYLHYQDWKRYEDYRLNAEDNEDYSAPNAQGELTVGMPAWCTLNARVQYAFSPLATIQLGIENILDTQYRTFASGIHGAGRNLNIAFNFHY